MHKNDILREKELRTGNKREARETGPHINTQKSANTSEMFRD